MCPVYNIHFFEKKKNYVVVKFDLKPKFGEKFYEMEHVCFIVQELIVNDEEIMIKFHVRNKEIFISFLNTPFFADSCHLTFPV